MKFISQFGRETEVENNGASIVILQGRRDQQRPRISLEVVEAEMVIKMLKEHCRSIRLMQRRSQAECEARLRKQND